MPLSSREQQELSALAAQLSEEDPDLAGWLTAGSVPAAGGLRRRWVFWSSVALLLPAVAGAVVTFAGGQPIGLGVSMLCLTLAAVGAFTVQLVGPAAPSRRLRRGRHAR